MLEYRRGFVRLLRSASLVAILSLATPALARAQVDVGIEEKIAVLRRSFEKAAVESKKCIFVEGDPLEKLFSKSLAEETGLARTANVLGYSVTENGKFIYLKKKFDDYADLPNVSPEEFRLSILSLIDLVDKYSYWAPGKGFADNWRSSMVQRNPELITAMTQRPMYWSELNIEDKSFFDRVLISEECLSFYDIVPAREAINEMNKYSVAKKKIGAYDGFTFDRESNPKPMFLWVNSFVQENGNLHQYEDPRLVRTAQIPICQTLGEIVAELQKRSEKVKLSVAPELADRQIFAASLSLVAPEAAMRSLAEFGGLAIEKKTGSIKLVRKPAVEVSSFHNFRTVIRSLFPEPLLRYFGFEIVEKREALFPGGFTPPPMRTRRKAEEVKSAAFSVLQSDVFRQTLKERRAIPVSELSSQTKRAILLQTFSMQTLDNILEAAPSNYEKFYGKNIEEVYFKAAPEGISGRLMLVLSGPDVNGVGMLKVFGGLPDPRLPK